MVSAQAEQREEREEPELAELVPKPAARGLPLDDPVSTSGPGQWRPAWASRVGPHHRKRLRPLVAKN